MFDLAILARGGTHVARRGEPPAPGDLRLEDLQRGTFQRISVRFSQSRSKSRFPARETQRRWCCALIAVETGERDGDNFSFPYRRIS
jgi:hypothetical protein